MCNMLAGIGPGMEVVFMAIVGTFSFNAFLSGVFSCIGTSVLGSRFSNLVRIGTKSTMFADS